MTDTGMSGLDSILTERLRTIGLDPGAFGEPGEAWRLLHERFGRRITLIDRYTLEAAHRGIDPDQLDDETRTRLQAETLRGQSPDLEFAIGSERAHDPIDVAPYDERWSPRFRAWRDRLAAGLGPVAIRIEHVGSTAVVGLAAKPIVDIQVSVADTNDEHRYVPAVEACGLKLRLREPGHRYFRPPAERPRDVHVHVCDADSVWEREHLLFRDYLRAHPAVRDKYAELKVQLAERYPDDRLAYTDAKSAFILDALDAALLWAPQVGWQLPQGKRARSSLVRFD